MKTLIDIPIFQAGRHRDMNGAAIIITEVELQKTVSTYQPSLHEAPLVIGHPQHDAPAWGWVSGLNLINGVLLATVQQVDPAFSEIVHSGRYKKVSASFYTPDAANNPVPGTYYLRHVGFLGAQPPAIKGLAAVSFTEEEGGVVTIIKQVANPMNHKQFQKKEHNDFSEIPLQQEVEMEQEQEQEKKVPQGKTEDKAQQLKQELDEREKQLLAREEKLQAKERESKQQKLINFIDQLIEEGRVLPKDREGLLALLARLEDSGVIEFSEGGAAGEMVSSKAASYFKEFIAALPVQVNFAETTANLAVGGQPPTYSTPRGYQVDQDGLTTHNKILAYAKTQNIDYLTAALTIGQ